MKTTITGLTEQEVKQKQEAGQGQAMLNPLQKQLHRYSKKIFLHYLTF